MSSRQLRKLQKQKELQELQANSLDEANDSSDDELPTQRPKTSLFSGFAALGGDDDQGDESDRDENEDEEVEAAVKPQVQPDTADTPKSSKKNKNKKKKKKAKKQEPAPTTADSTSKTGPDEIDQALQELDLRKDSEDDSNGFSITNAYERVCELLSINTYHLKVINEMRNLFGREAIAAAQTEEQEQARERRGQHGLNQPVDLETYLKGQPGKGLPEVTLRRNPFLTGKESWPRASTEGLTMVELKEIDDGAMPIMPGTVEFRFAHNETYNELENRFFDLVRLYDPMQIVHFLHLHPYHVCSLIQVSKIAEQDQNSACAADLCERALFTFGRVSLSAFRQKIEQGKARLSFNRPENRQFWLAGYHYLKNLIKKGTNRTALEWAKLLLSIDHTDPYGMMNFIHPLAIRAHESKWFIDLCDSDILSVDLDCHNAADYIVQTRVLAILQQKDTAGAKEVLIDGMEDLPWLYHNLFKALNLDIPKSLWGKQPRNRQEDLHTSVYIHQTKGLWDNPQSISLLKEAASEAKIPDSFESLPRPASVSRDFARFVFMLEVPSLMGLIPQGFLTESVNWEFDPMPPPYGQNIFSHETQRKRWRPEGIDEGLDFVLAENPELLRRLANRAGQAPQGGLDRMMEQIMEIAAGADDDDGGNDSGEDEVHGEVNPGVIGAVYRTLMSMINPQGAAQDLDSDQEYTDNMPMPGGLRNAALWDETVDDDDDDEMPPLIPRTEATDNGENDKDDANDGTDDELPDLI
ncbi:DUF654-domain-containing protein [Hypomontagnella submonticulosa]|nr:DUF654-domain-containing protein [Hypomontagnella submonticulosa]